MNIAFIGHSYHERTRSSAFFIKLLKKLGHVETFYDEDWRLEPSPWARDFDANKFDCIVVWQMTSAFRHFREPHPNILFVPMYDAMLEGGKVRWRRTFNSAKVLCFSSALHRAVSRRTPRSSYFQYFPDPRQYPAVHLGKTLRGIFWNRVPAIDESVIARLCGDAVFDQFTVRDATDPLSGARIMKETPIPTRSLKHDRWRENRRDYLKEVARHNVFFAPRSCEGIGMSMLEAMAMGLCVVATDKPTHNEYISNGKTGILYDLESITPVSLANAAELGARARESIEKGFKRWSAMEDQLMNFVSLPTNAFDTQSRQCSA